MKRAVRIVHLQCARYYQAESALASGQGRAYLVVESSMYSSAPTSFRTSRTGIGNRRRVGSRTTFGAES
jgi:hypothetical protein